MLFSVHIHAQIQPGDTLQFWSVSYIDWQPATAPPQRLISAECRLVGDSCYVFVDLSIAQPPSQARLETIATRFDTAFSRQLPPLYGPIPDEIDQDPRIFILIIPSEGWTGYFDPAQQMADSTVFQRWGKHSSEREIVYISTDAFVYNAEIFNLVHEFGHMLHWGQDHSPEPPANPVKFWEDAWIDESFAMFATAYLLEDITLPNMMDYNAFFASNPDLPLIHFISYYSYNQVKLWLTFMFEHYEGTNFISMLIQDQANGIPGVRNTLNLLGYTESFEETFEHWVLANYLDDEQYLNGYYSYHHYNFPSPHHSAIHNSFPINISNGSLSAFAADYILCHATNPAPLQISFQGDSLSRFRLSFILKDQQSSTIKAIHSIDLDSLNLAVFTADSFGMSYDRLVMVVMNVDSAMGENETAGYSYQLNLMTTPIVENLPSGTDNSFPPTFSLYQNYPNPFNPKTTIEFDLPKSTRVTVKVFNLLGEEVATLLSTSLPSGSHSVEWDASKMTSGVYLYRLQADDYVETRKMVMMK